MHYEMFVRAHGVLLAGAMVCLVAAEIMLLAVRTGSMGRAKAVLVVSRIGSALAGIGLLTGLGLLAVGPWPWGAPWLIASFILIAALMAVGAKLVKPWQASFQVAVTAGRAVETRTLAADAGGMRGRLLFLGFFLLIMGVMVAKPALF